MTPLEELLVAAAVSEALLALTPLSVAVAWRLACELCSRRCLDVRVARPT